ncbi:tryptophan--tRNA ligase [Jatrophihabitans sp.]|uniref:tryptophan--tRNA ligase n=1 Tax=Jatrophihabitans sp. TaxID=1932789 RepID=UPI002BA4522B|nr:tryptophan--tRNA ligase [Jatrophihabitans sp.]
MTATTTAPGRAVAPATGRTVAGRVLTGDRPTGGLHLGHYFGTLANRVRLQRQGCELFVVVADYQVVTDRDRPVDLPELRTAMVLDYLACGIDPDASTIFAHSAVPALNQLLLPFLSLVSTGELDRNPTVKEEIRTAGRSSVSALMLTYPVHQAADILFCKAELVPVGKDQLPHLELTRAIARRFNERYGPVFGLPEELLGATGTLLGLDGRKMSKSLGNGIALSDSPDQVAAKVRAARTDSERRISYAPDIRPEVATLLTLAGLCLGEDPAAVAERIGTAGAAELKRVVIDAVNGLLAPIRARRAGLGRADAEAILRRGADRAREIADQTLAEVNAAMRMG